MGPVLFMLVGCSDYTIFRPGDIDVPAGMTDSAIPRVAVPDPVTACDTWVMEAATDVNVDESCVHEPVFGLLDAHVEWQATSFGEFPGYDDVVMAPVVGQLDDDNGDGVVNRLDTPDVIVVTDDGSAGADGNPLAGVLRRLRGSDGAQIWGQQSFQKGETQVLPYRYSNVALADVNGDSRVDLVFAAMVMGPPVQDTAPPDTDPPPDESPPDDSVVPIDPGPPSDHEGEDGGGVPCHVVAVDALDRSIQWTSEDSVTCGGHAPAVADLEGDGDVEVVLGNILVDGRTGATIAVGNEGMGRASGNLEFGAHPVASDLDMDGVQEILAGNTLYDPSGQVICRTGTDDGYPAPADLDMDGVGEFVLVAGGAIGMFEADCSRVWSNPLNGGGHGGPPTVADFDADGVPEIGVAEASTYTVYETDGSVLWSQPVTDESSHTTGSVVFDFEGDGRPEVVYGDEMALWVFAGHDGTVRLMDELHESRTLHEFPTVVDVDGDGETEILVPNAGTHYSSVGLGGLYVLGSETSSWLGNRQVWNQHGYCISNIEDDLSVPSPARSNWPTHNNFRSGDPNPVSGGRSPDVVVQAEACDLECEVDQVAVVVRLGNGGMAALPDWIPITMHDSQGNVLKVSFSSGIVQPGEVSDPIVLRLAADEVPSDGVVVITADENGAGAQIVRECHEDNNVTTVQLPCGD